MNLIDQLNALIPACEESLTKAARLFRAFKREGAP